MQYIFSQVVFIFIVTLKPRHALPSCTHPPCRYDVIRSPEDMSGLVVRDNSLHSINWSWEVRGGSWNVTYKYNYPSGWYEGTAIFVNCSTYMAGKEQATVSWGYIKNWESNAIPVYANAWNINYNGDVFGFIPSNYGRYTFRIYSKNKRHNPFGEDLHYPPDFCTLSSNDKKEMSKWWLQKKAQKNCQEATIIWNWNSNRGRWKILYKRAHNTDITTCSVTYRNFATGQEVEVINWELDVPMKSIKYKTNPMRIVNENSWQLALSPSENWGFTPTGDGQWIFQHLSRNIVFRPFNDVRGALGMA